MISPKIGYSGAALLAFTLFACGSPQVTQGTVVAATYDPAHPKFKRVCKVKVGANCKKWDSKPDGIDDADYEIQIKDGDNTSWIEIDDADVYQACPVGVKYPACANPGA